MDEVDLHTTDDCLDGIVEFRRKTDDQTMIAENVGYHRMADDLVSESGTHPQIVGCWGGIASCLQTDLRYSIAAVHGELRNHRVSSSGPIASRN